MKKRDPRSGPDNQDDCDGNDDKNDDVDGDKTGESRELTESQPSTAPHVTDGSSRYDEETSTITDFTSASKTNTTVTTVDHYYYTTDTTTLSLTNTTIVSYSTTSSTMSSYTPIREMMSTAPPSSGSPGPLLTTQGLVWLVTFPSFLIAIVVLLLIIWFFLKTFRSRSKERRNQPDAEEKVGKPKGKDGNIDVEYHHAVKPSNYYTEVVKEPKSTSKGAESKAKASLGQYEEIDKISPAGQPKSMTSSNHGDNQGYEETSQHKTPFYYTLEPPDNGVSNDGEVTSHQHLGYDKLDRGRDPNNIGTGNNQGYAKLDHTPRGTNDYDRLNRDGAIEKPSQDNEISTNEYSQLDIQVSSASASYDKLNHERTNTGK